MKRDGRCADSICAGCRRQTSVTAGTILHASKLRPSGSGPPTNATPSLGPAAPETARYRLLPAALGCSPQAAAPASLGQPRCSTLSGLVEIDEASLPFRTTYRRARTQPRRQDASSAPSNSRKLPGRLGRNLSPADLPNPDAIRKPTAGPAAAVPADVKALLTSSCRGTTSPTSKMGARRLPRAEEAFILSTAAVRSLFRLHII